MHESNVVCRGLVRIGAIVVSRVGRYAAVDVWDGIRSNVFRVVAVLQSESALQQRWTRQCVVLLDSCTRLDQDGPTPLRRRLCVCRATGESSLPGLRSFEIETFLVVKGTQDAYGLAFFGHAFGLASPTRIAWSAPFSCRIRSHALTLGGGGGHCVIFRPGEVGSEGRTSTPAQAAPDSRTCVASRVPRGELMMRPRARPGLYELGEPRGAVVLPPIRCLHAQTSRGLDAKCHHLCW